MNISSLAKRHGLSRSTLLYYDRIGVLAASGRLHSGYRHYTERDEARLRRICLYRRMGLPLAQIRSLLDRPPRRELARALERQLHELGRQAETLRARQRLIVAMLQDRRLLERLEIRGKVPWVKLLRASGFSEADLHAWHRDFERLDPDYHRRFLEFLGLPANEIETIRAQSRLARK